jgi:hypothetical protein
MQHKPDFFIVGAPKAGTTALHAFLDLHPQVCMSADKEPNYFSHREIASQQLYYSKTNVESETDYLALFQCNENVLATGEASVSYLFYPEVAKRIYDFNPKAKIIISLREPVARAFSHYQMDYSLGLVPYSFDEIFTNGIEDPKTGIYFQQYILLSEYYMQVKRYLDQFPENQVLILFHEELVQEEEKVLHRLCEFLNIDPTLRTAVFEQINVTAAGRNVIIRKLYSIPAFRKVLRILFSEKIKNKLKSMFFSKDTLPKLSSTTNIQLHNRFRNDVTSLAAMLHRDLSAWL